MVEYGDTILQYGEGLSTILFNITQFLSNFFNGFFVLTLLIALGIIIIIYFRFIEQSMTKIVRE
jgi:hypothetical protein